MAGKFTHLVFILAIALSACTGAREIGVAAADTGADRDAGATGDADTCGDAGAADCGGTPDTGLPPGWHEPSGALRTTRSLDGKWSFVPQGYPAREVTVPCFWEAVPAAGYDVACPGYFDGTPDEGLAIEEGNNWGKRTIHRGTYTLAIDIPNPAPVTRVWFEALHHQADLYINDAPAGSHIGAYWKAGFDISPTIAQGSNTLRVELTDGTALLGKDGYTDWPVGNYAHTSITGIYRSVTMEELPAVYIADSQIVPSVRRADLTVAHTIVNSTGEDATIWVISRAVGEDGPTAMETAATSVEVPAHATATVVVVQPWKDAVLWGPNEPYLYTLRTLVMDSNGEPVDLREDRFGFREVWIENGDYMLNGMRMNLFGDSVDDQASRSRYWEKRYFSCDTARETLARIKGLNIGTVRFHQAPPADCVLDAADELGLLIVSESSIYARIDILPPFNNDPVYVKHGRQWLDQWVRRQRNRPSIIMWSLENEMWMYGWAMTEEQVLTFQDPARAADTVRRPDGVDTAARPVSWDGDSSFMRQDGLAVESISFHYPAVNAEGKWITLNPEKEWFEDALANFEPFLVSDVPDVVGETTVNRPKQKPDSRSFTEVKAMQGIAVRALRILGFDGGRPSKLNWAWSYYYPDGTEHPWAPYYHSLYSQEEKDLLLKIVRESFHPIAVFDREYTRVCANLDGTLGPVSLPAKAGVERTLVVLNDSFMPGVPQKVTWWVVDEKDGSELARDSFETTVEHGFSEVMKIGFTTPEAGTAEEPRNLTLHITCEMAGLPHGAFETEYRFVVDAR